MSEDTRPLTKEEAKHTPHFLTNRAYDIKNKCFIAKLNDNSVYSTTGRYLRCVIVGDQEVNDTNLRNHFGRVNKIDDLDYYAFTGTYHGKKVRWNLE
jgi:hypothetical protein